MKIYTKTGDDGTTSLVGGTRVAKDSPQVEAYGTVDELIAWTGWLRAQHISTSQNRQLRHIQGCLMTCAALLAADSKTHKQLPVITDNDIHEIEQAIDAMQANLPPLKAFVLPAGPPVTAACHIARCVCRRAERRAIKALPSDSRNNVLNFLNRLSDYLFTLSRQLVVDSGASEDYWLP